MIKLYTANPRYRGNGKVLAMITDKSLNNHFTRGAEKVYKLPKAQEFEIRILPEYNGDLPYMELKTVVDGENVEVIIETTLKAIYGMIKEGNGLNENFEFNSNKFYMHQGEFKSIEANQTAYNNLLITKDEEKKKMKEKKVITKSKLLPFQKYLTKDGVEEYFVCLGVLGQESTEKQMIVLNYTDSDENLTVETAYKMLLNGEYTLKDKSDYVEKTDRILFKYNQTPTNVDSFLFNYRRFALLHLLNDFNGFADVTVESINLSTTELINDYLTKATGTPSLFNLTFNKPRKTQRAEESISNDKVKKLYELNQVTTKEELLNYATNGVELMLVYIHLIDLHLKDKYVWENDKRYRDSISNRYHNIPRLFSSTFQFTQDYNKFAENF